MADTQTLNFITPPYVHELQKISKSYKPDLSEADSNTFDMILKMCLDKATDQAKEGRFDCELDLDFKSYFNTSLHSTIQNYLHNKLKNNGITSLVQACGNYIIDADGYYTSNIVYSGIYKVKMFW